MSYEVRVTGFRTKYQAERWMSHYEGELEQIMSDITEEQYDFSSIVDMKKMRMVKDSNDSNDCMEMPLMVLSSDESALLTQWKDIQVGEVFVIPHVYLRYPSQVFVKLSPGRYLREEDGEWIVVSTSDMKNWDLVLLCSGVSLTEEMKEKVEFHTR